MTHREAVLAALKKFGPMSDYALFHAIRTFGIKASPSSVRTRRRELTADRLVKRARNKFETTPAGRQAQIWRLA